MSHFIVYWSECIGGAKIFSFLCSLVSHQGIITVYQVLTFGKKPCSIRMSLPKLGLDSAQMAWICFAVEENDSEISGTYLMSLVFGACVATIDKCY